MVGTTELPHPATLVSRLRSLRLQVDEHPFYSESFIVVEFLRVGSRKKRWYLEETRVIKLKSKFRCLLEMDYFYSQPSPAPVRSNVADPRYLRSSGVTPSGRRCCAGGFYWRQDICGARK